MHAPTKKQRCKKQQTEFNYCQEPCILRSYIIVLDAYRFRLIATAIQLPGRELVGLVYIISNQIPGINHRTQSQLFAVTAWSQFSVASTGAYKPGYRLQSLTVRQGC